ncbi:hypothetical protein [uncultured Desulfuromonas sp.]|uniref:hypothetical protein n=1 Tax=uncultured Desulfuromonas sp. TaxID=181013 RepID=UPI002AABFA5C|nr:hypothetical protein [uncultured Desulfuromonas sp.]
MKVREQVFDHIQKCGDLRDALPRMGYRSLWVRCDFADIPVERRWLYGFLLQRQDCGIVYEDTGRDLIIISVC